MSKIYRKQIMFYLHIFYYCPNFVHMYFKLLARISTTLDFSLVNAKQVWKSISTERRLKIYLSHHLNYCYENIFSIGVTFL